MNDAAHSTVYDILTTLNTVYGENYEQTSGYRSSGGWKARCRDLEEVAEVVGRVSQSVVIDEEAHQPDSVEDLSKKEVRDLMLKDPWAVGRKLFAKKDILHFRTDAARRQKKKAMIHLCILNGIRKMTERVTQIIVGCEQLISTKCLDYTKRRPNNLGVK